MIKFLDLNTGYTFDGLWREWDTVWNIDQIDSSYDESNYIGYDVKYTKITNNVLDPNKLSSIWTDTYEKGLSKWIAYRSPQTKGYTFWFPNEQSTNLTYSMPICIIDDTINDMTLTIEDNSVFSFITHDNTESIDGYTFNTPIYSKTLNIKSLDCETIGDKRAYVFNVAATSKVEGEFVCKINIGDKGYIRVGADFYEEYEPTYINLSNMGVEIPDTVQKAIYDSNIHEDFKDNILLNRKFKELLSNYWDIIACKGSYKSLKNSLEWFEWNDALVIKELMKRDEAGITYFSDKNLMSIFEDSIKGTFENLSKPTYISLFYSIYKDSDIYDSEYNPVLAKTAMKWSIEDMQLKMSLLAQFFGTFFLPIHMSIFHATVEDSVYSNTIKAIHGSNTVRDDSFGDFTYIYSNIKDNDIFKMHNVRAQVTTDTMFGVNYGQHEISFGVDEFTSYGKVNESNIKTFSSQYYAGPGVIIPFEIEILNQTAGDFIQHTIVDFTSSKDKITRLNFHNRIYSKNGKFFIKFNFLAKEAMKYSIRFTFITASSKTLTKNFIFKVEDTDNLVLNVYKVKSKDDSNGFTKEDFLDISNTNYMIRTSPKIYKNEKDYEPYTQYLPYMLPDNPLFKNYDGIKLTRTVVFNLDYNSKGKKYTDYEISVIKGFMNDNFLEFFKYDKEGNIINLIYISKHFYEEIPAEIATQKRFNFNITRNELGFYPQFHYLELMNGDKLEDYTVSQYEAVCCSAEINHGRKNERFRYSHMIDEAEWNFYNPATLETVNHPSSSRVPFAASDKTTLSPGYYDISFKYSLTNGVKDECRRDSAFRIKVI